MRIVSKLVLAQPFTFVTGGAPVCPGGLRTDPTSADPVPAAPAAKPQP